MVVATATIVGSLGHSCSCKWRFEKSFHLQRLRLQTFSTVATTEVGNSSAWSFRCFTASSLIAVVLDSDCHFFSAGGLNGLGVPVGSRTVRWTEFQALQCHHLPRYGHVLHCLWAPRYPLHHSHLHTPTACSCLGLHYIQRPDPEMRSPLVLSQLLLTRSSRTQSRTHPHRFVLLVRCSHGLAGYLSLRAVFCCCATARCCLSELGEPAVNNYEIGCRCHCPTCLNSQYFGSDCYGPKPWVIQRWWSRLCCCDPLPPLCQWRHTGLGQSWRSYPSKTLCCCVPWSRGERWCFRHQPQFCSYGLLKQHYLMVPSESY